MNASTWTASRCNGRGGFTLVELIVALGIFAAAFTVLLAAHTGATKQQANARKAFIATGLARSLLTETELGGLPDIGETEGDFGDEFPDYTWKQEVDDVSLDQLLGATAAMLGAAGITVPASGLGLRQVILVVEWLEQGSVRNISVIYYMVEP